MSVETLRKPDTKHFQRILVDCQFVWLFKLPRSGLLYGRVKMQLRAIDRIEGSSDLVDGGWGLDGTHVEIRASEKVISGWYCGVTR